MNVQAQDVWTGDFIVKHAGIVTKLQLLPDDTHIRIFLADTITTSNPEAPIEMVNERALAFPLHQQIDVVRDRPLPNGMHMTQFDAKGMCHGRAHPALEQRLRAEGKMAR